MSVLVLDTNIVSYLMKSHSLAASYRPHLLGHTLAVSFMTVAELFEGAFRRSWSERRIMELRGILKGYVVIPASPVVCEEWARIRAERRSSPISVDDAWIAAAASVHKCPLVTHNPDDFQGIASLHIVTVLSKEEGSIGVEPTSKGV